MKHNVKAIGSILENVLNDINADDPIAKKKIISDWQDLFDSTIGKVCRPVQFTEHDVLILEAISESWRNELKNVKPMIITALKSKFNRLKIKDVKII